MNRSSKASGLLCLAAAITLIAGGRAAALPDTDTKCALTEGCRVVGKADGDYWCCCKTSTGEDCDTIIVSGTRRPTIVSPQSPGNSQPGQSKQLSPGGLKR